MLYASGVVVEGDDAVSVRASEAVDDGAGFGGLLQLGLLQDFEFSGLEHLVGRFHGSNHMPIEIPTKPDTCTDLKPDGVPRRSRTRFRGEAGHFQRRPCGSYMMISEPRFELQEVLC